MAGSSNASSRNGVCRNAVLTPPPDPHRPEFSPHRRATCAGGDTAWELGLFFEAHYIPPHDGMAGAISFSTWFRHEGRIFGAAHSLEAWGEKHWWPAWARDHPDDEILLRSGGLDIVIFGPAFELEEIAEFPIILYDREPHRHFWADWQVRVLRIAENGESEGSVCTGHGRSAYEPGLKIAEMRLSEYVGTHCNLMPARYALRTEWALDNGVTVKNASNVFGVNGQI